VVRDVDPPTWRFALDGTSTFTETADRVDPVTPYVHEPGERDPSHRRVGMHEQPGPFDVDRRESIRDPMGDREARGAHVHPPRPPPRDLVDDGHFESSPHSERPFHHPSHPLFERASWVHPTDLRCPGRPPRRVGVGGPHRRRARRPPDFDALAHGFEPTPRQTRGRPNPSGEPMHEPPQPVRDRMGSEATPE
jgi:hypothetical protein